MGAEQFRGRSERSLIETAPASVRSPGHVGDHRMGVQVRLQVAVGLVAEGGGHHRRRLHAGMAPRGPVPLPGDQQLLLDEVERRPHGQVMRPDDPGIARHQRRERHRFWRLHRDVDTRAVLALSVADAPEHRVRSRHLAGENRLEAGRSDMATETEIGRAPSVPAARFPVLRIVLRVVAVLLEIAGGDGRRGQGRDGGDH